MSIHTARQRRLPRPSGRQTAASMALTPYARRWRCGQAPKPRSGAPKAQGLTASPTAAAQSDVPSSTITFSTHPRPPIDTPITPRNYTSLTDAIRKHRNQRNSGRRPGSVEATMNSGTSFIPVHVTTSIADFMFSAPPSRRSAFCRQHSRASFAADRRHSCLLAPMLTEHRLATALPILSTQSR